MVKIFAIRHEILSNQSIHDFFLEYHCCVFDTGWLQSHKNRGEDLELIDFMTTHPPP